MEEQFLSIIQVIAGTVLTFLAGFITKFIKKQSDLVHEKIKNEVLGRFYALVEDAIMQSYQVHIKPVKDAVKDGKLDKKDIELAKVQARQFAVDSINKIISGLPKFLRSELEGKASDILESKIQKTKAKQVNLMMPDIKKKDSQ